MTNQYNISEITCNPTQIDKLRKLGMPKDITKLVDAINWLGLNKNVFVTVELGNIYNIGYDQRIVVKSKDTTVYRVSYCRYERCLMDGLDIALDFFLDYLLEDPVIDECEANLLPVGTPGYA